ncbi:ABC transporter permease [Asanoa sp. NPDC049573]|uniref:ABC transporter permease n=1 Tax=Asanoa sp. NPDC049573 TaxID=3155396 RepID=UPI00342A5274
MGGYTAMLALHSLRHRRTAFTATFMAVLLGTAVIGSFATLVETATGPISSADAETLAIMGAVVGGWGALIVLFSVASTVGITVTQRDAEIGLLRTIGATARQARRLVRAETLAVCLAASIAGALVASVTGRALLAAVGSAGLIDQADYGGGMVSLAITVGGVLLVCLAAAGVAGRRATHGPASVAPGEDRAGAGRMRWWRVAAAVALIAYGGSLAIVTVTVTKNAEDPYDAMLTSGSNSILVGVGLALLAPVLLRWGSLSLRPVLGRRRAEAHLARYNTSRRAHLLAGVLGPVIVLTSSAVGTLMAVGTDGRTLPGRAAEDSDTITLLNNVVVSMLSLFAAIMVINAYAAAIAHRRAELRRLRLLGATPTQVERSIVAEAAVVAAVGVALGLVASLATIVPFGLARGEGVVPDGQLWLPPLLVAGVVCLTLGAARGAVRRTARPELARAA